MYRVNLISLLCEDVRRLQVTLKDTAWEGVWLINNFQMVDKVQTLLLLALVWSLKCGEPLAVIPAAWFPCPVCHYADLEPSSQGLCCRNVFIVVMLREATQQLEYLRVFLQSGFLWLHPVITVLPTRWTLDMVWCLLLQHWLPRSFCVCLPPPKTPLVLRLLSPGNWLQMVWFRKQFKAFLSSALWRGRFKFKSGKCLCFVARMDTLKFPITQMEDSVNVHNKIPGYQHVAFISILYDISLWKCYK